MLRSLQFHEYEMIIAIVFLHYPDLQNRQLPPGMWFLHFGRDMAQGNQELGLPASPTGRRVRPALGRAEGKGEKCPVPTLLRRRLLRGGPEARAECGLCIPLASKSLRMLGSHRHAAIWQVRGQSISEGSARSVNITVQIRRPRPSSAAKDLSNQS